MAKNKDTAKTNLDGPDITGLINDDVVQPFLLETPNFRGRMVRLGSVLNEILGKHNYPEPVEKLLIKALTITALLAGMLKFKGVFTLQTKGDGIIPTMACDITHDGALRGFAIIRGDSIKEDHEYSFKELVGDGYIALTVDQENAERYQGLVELEGETIVDAIHSYFRQSEQIKAGIQLYCTKNDNGQWQSAAIMIQSLPQEDEQEHMQGKSNLESDHWRRVMMLLETATAEEMNDPKIAVNDMVYRLFHEETVRVFDPLQLRHTCRCSRERVINIIQQSLTSENVGEYIEDGRIYMDCEFCSERYEFDESEIHKLLQ